MLIIEWFAAIFGLLSVLMTIRQNVWCWPVGLVQVILYIFVFYQARLYSDMLLHMIYVVLQLYGWYEWHYGGRKHAALKVTRLSVKVRLFAWLGMIMVSLLWGTFMALKTNAAAPIADAFIIVASLFATCFLAKKILDAWFFWIFVDVIAVGVYFYKSLFPTTILYSFFLVLAVLGYFEWRKSYSGEKALA